MTLGLGTTILALVSLGPRLAVRFTCVVICAFQAFTVCLRAVTLSPDEILDGLDKTVQSAYGLIVFCFASGFMLAVQPRAYLTFQVKLLVGSTTMSLRMSGLLVMAARANALRSVGVVAMCSDLPFAIGFSIPLLMAAKIPLIACAGFEKVPGSGRTSLWP